MSARSPKCSQESLKAVEGLDIPAVYGGKVLCTTNATSRMLYLISLYFIKSLCKSGAAVRDGAVLLSGYVNYSYVVANAYLSGNNLNGQQCIQ